MLFRKTISALILMLIFLLASLPALAENVNGIIEADTAWTLDQSPYIVTGNIRVAEGATLDIAPGVKVLFRTAPIDSVGYYIQVDGTLRAQGDAENPILFTAEESEATWGCLAFTSTSTTWDEATATGCVLSHCVIEYAGNNQAAAVLCLSASPLIENNTIRYSLSDGISVSGGVQNIVSNLIHHNNRGISLSCWGARVENNYIADNRQGISMGSSIRQIDIRNNTIISSSSEVYGGCLSINLYYNGDPTVDAALGDAVSAARAAAQAAEVAEAEAQAAEAALKDVDPENYLAAADILRGLQTDADKAAKDAATAAGRAEELIAISAEIAAELAADITVSKNNIRNNNEQSNAIAITERDSNANYKLSFKQNNIDNSEGNLSVYVYNWQDRDPDPISMESNWWETTDFAAIDQMVYDFSNDFYLPEVDYLPISAHEIPDAGSDLSYEPVTDGDDDTPDDEDDPDDPDDGDEDLPDQPGVISRDTVWSLDQSPYMITGNILVKKDVTLKIEPGVTVLFKAAPVESVGYFIQVNGVLEARGQDHHPICFTTEDKNIPWGYIAFTETSTPWDETTGTGAVLSHCIIEYAGGSSQSSGGASVICSGASPLIKDNIIRYSTGNAVRVSGGAPQILSNRIHDVSAYGISITSADGLVANNYLMNNPQGIAVNSANSKIEIRNNSVISSSPATYGACLSISLAYHEIPAEIDIHDNHFINSSKEGNAIAITESLSDANDLPEVTRNNIESLEGNLAVYLYNWKQEIPSPISMGDNWWGTTDTDVIDQLIYDSQNDFYLPEAAYAPVAGEKIYGAWSDLLYPPMANAGEDQTVERDMTVTLYGNASFDPDKKMNYQWTQTSGPSVSVSGADTVNPTFVSPAFDPDNAVLTFQLTLKDDRGFYDTDTVSITVTDSVKTERDEGQCFIGTAASASFLPSDRPSFSKGVGRILVLLLLCGTGWLGVLLMRKI
ncbi:MAG: hypothetical protein B6245_12340 [Desulfobacteraceae bacterium 4572_88]|nr:MAG: hypothetical protein B6245_12340 [Desulfobacteraceae bacterium 4572_88]